MYCITFTGIQKAHLNASLIRSQAHLSAQSINLAYKMTLRRTTNARIAGHKRHIIQGQGCQKGFTAHASSSQSSFNTCVTSTYYDYIKFVSNKSHNFSVLKIYLPIQKREKIWLIISSCTVSPVISPNKSIALRTSITMQS